MYSEEQKNILLSLARDSIKTYLQTKEEIKIYNKEIDPSLLEDRGVFVTLTINNRLRGCIGHLKAIQSLYKDVIQNSISAAFQDPRFNPLSKKELKEIKIEISILSIPKKLDYSNSKDLLNKLTPLKDGIIIKKGFKQATYLPQVWEDLPSKEDFLSSLCSKAGLSPNEWKTSKLEVQTYKVEKFEE